MVVGYAPTPPRVASSGRVIASASWEVLFLVNGALDVRHYTSLENMYLLEEWL